MMHEFCDVLRRERVIAVMRAMPPCEVIDAAASLFRGEIRVMEVAFSHPGADEALWGLVRSPLPGATIGAGTVTSMDVLRRALDAGARFVVTPHVVPEVIEACVARRIPVVPGALTPTEIHTCLALGAPAVKVFPAAVMGPRYIRDLLGPYPNACLVPTGGVGLDNASEYLEAGALAVGIGASLFRPGSDIEASARNLASALAKYRRA